MSKLGILKEFCEFIKERKLYVILPIMVILILLSLLMIFAQSSAISPLIYTMF